MSEPAPQTSQHDWLFAALFAVSGLVAGIAIWLLTSAVSHAAISGNGWSLSGNGALIVPFGIGPALVAAGWTAIILRMRGHPRWRELGAGSGLIALALVACSLLSVIVFGPQRRDAGATGSLLFGFLLYGWLVGTSIVAVMIKAPDPPRAGPPIWSVAAFILFPITLIAGCEAGGLVVPT